MKVRIAALISLLALPILLSLLGGTVHAVNSSLRQQILPLDCVFQTVNDGNGTIIYLTPTECGQIIKPPSSPPKQDTGGTSNETSEATPPASAVITTVDTGSAIVQVPFVTVPNTNAARIQQILGAVQYLPYEPLAQLRETSETESTINNNMSTAVPIPVVALGAITVVIVVLILIL